MQGKPISRPRPPQACYRKADDITTVTFIKLIGCLALSVYFLIYRLHILYMVLYVISLSHYLTKFTHFTDKQTGAQRSRVT